MTKTNDEIIEELDLAIFNNDVKKFTELFSNEYANAKDEFGTSLLHNAAGGGCEEIVLILLRAGADVNILDEDKNNGEYDKVTPLIFSLSGRHYRISKLLIKQNTNLDIVDKHGNQALWTAVMSLRFKDTDFSILNDLLKKGADPHHKNNVNKSPYDAIKTFNKKELLDIFEPYI